MWFWCLQSTTNITAFHSPLTQSHSSQQQCKHVARKYARMRITFLKLCRLFAVWTAKSLENWEGKKKSVMRPCDLGGLHHPTKRRLRQISYQFWPTMMWFKVFGWCATPQLITLFHISYNSFSSFCLKYITKSFRSSLLQGRRAAFSLALCSRLN